MVREPLVWKTTPGACDVEPPGFQSLPFSSTMTSQYPRSVSSSANEQPTIPAPIITIFAINAPEFLLIDRYTRKETASQGIPRLPADPKDTHPGKCLGRLLRPNVVLVRCAGSMPGSG